MNRYWDCAPRSRNSFPRFFQIFILLLLAGTLGPLSTFAAPQAPNAELESVLQKIESRHYRWIAIQSDVYLFFAGAANGQAMCGGELLYQRLDERMLLTCADTHGKPVFTFRTFDRRFDLYLPSQKTVYHGSIFDLENSPDIESHLKARDLYRALKPLAVDPRRAKIERANSAITSLEVYSPRNGEDVLSRKLLLTPEGDVRGEVFYDAAGRSATEIQRYDFKEIPGRTGIYRSIIFPKKVTIVSPETKKGTALFFSKVKARDTVDPLEFLLKVPSGTKEIFLEEKALAQNAKTPERESQRLLRRPAPVVKEVPVYLATPLEKPAVKRSPAPRKKEASKEKETVSAPALPATPSAAQDVSKEADLAVEPPASSGASPESYNQYTLDPSVEPTA